MSFFDLVLIGIGLSMDAFAVSVCKGLSVKRVEAKHVLLCGAYFGVFQGLMPVVGYLLSSRFSSLLSRAGGWIAFALLALIGINMIRESFSGGDEDEEACPDFEVKTMLALAIATSIDALAVGVSLAAVGADIIPAALLFCAITFCLAAVGVRFGAIFGAKFEGLAERVGGCVLIGIGIKLLLGALGLL